MNKNLFANQDKVVSLRLSNDLYNYVKEMADAYNISVSSFFRLMIYNFTNLDYKKIAEEYGLKFEKKEKK